MRNGVISISQKELTRYDVLRRVLDGTISLADAAGYTPLNTMTTEA